MACCEFGFDENEFKGPSDGLAEKPEEPKPGRKIAIVGKAPSCKEAPFADKSWEIWGLGDVFKSVDWFPEPKDLWFEIHEWKPAGFARWLPDHVEFLTEKCPCPIICNGNHHEKIGNTDQRQYPIKEVILHFGRKYFTNTVAYQIALAVYQHDHGQTVEKLGIYGVDMAQSDPVQGANGEYEHQRPSCEYWIGLAEGRGINVYIPGASDLLKVNRLYGFDTHAGDFWVRMKKRRQELEQRRANALHQKKQFEVQQHHLEGAISNQQYVENNYCFEPPKDWTK